MRAGLRGALKALAASLLLLGFVGASSAGGGRTEVVDVPVTLLADDFSHFHDETAQTPKSDRVRLFRERFNRLLPGFYEPRYGKSQAAYDAQVANALDGFPTIRRDYDRMLARFPSALASGVTHVRQTFPDFRPHLPIVLLHSLGEMDGGTRVLRGRNTLIFGIDRIAGQHADASLGPFIDHELFHAHHARFYQDCARIRCSLWQEGLATYAASAMNQTRNPHFLMLDGLAPEVDAAPAKALCLVRSKLDASAQADREMIFYGGERAKSDPFPRRFGYYVGYLVAREAAKTTSLTGLTHLNRRQAAFVMDRAFTRLIDQAGGCPGKFSASATVRMR